MVIEIEKLKIEKFAFSFDHVDNSCVDNSCGTLSVSTSALYLTTVDNSRLYVYCFNQEKHHGI